MLNRDLPIQDDWQLSWLARTLPAFRAYVLLTSYTLSLLIITLGILGFITIRRSSRALVKQPSDRYRHFQTMNAQILRMTRAHFFVAHAYLLNVLAIILVDCYISLTSIRNDISSHSELWTTKAIAEVVAYILYCLGLFLAAQMLLPLAQMVLVTKLLSRFRRHHSLETFIPEARFFSTHAAQIWAMVTFFIVSWWTPTESKTIWRYIVVQACLGSALAWLEASYAFNFHGEKLEQEDLEAVSNGGVRRALIMFVRTVRTVHGGEKKGLPVHEEAVPEQRALVEKEKEAVP